MAKGYKTGGRKKGTPNKDKQVLRDKLKESFPDYDPILAMAEMAQDTSLEASIRVTCHKSVAEYTYPKMRPVDCHEEEDSPPLDVTFIVEPPDDSTRITIGK